MTEENKVYSKCKELIILFKKHSDLIKYATILENNMYKEVWTTGSELYEELLKIIGEWLGKEKYKFDKQMIKIMDDILVEINNYFKNCKITWHKTQARRL